MADIKETALVKEHMKIVYAVIRKLNIKGSGFQDAVQVGSMALLEAIRSFDANEAAQLTTWVHSKVSWRLKDWLDTETRIRRGYSFDADPESQGNEAEDWAPKFTDTVAQDTDDEVSTGHDWYQSKRGQSTEFPEYDENNAVREVLNEVSPALQEVAIGTIRGETLPETAARLGISRATVIRRKEQLRKALEKVKGPFGSN